MWLKKELYELIRSDERIFDFIQNSALDGLWYWDLENPEFEWMNAKFWTVLGYNPDEMPHKSSAWQNIINIDDLKVANENLTKHCENPNHPYDQVVRYTHKDGSTVWIHCRGLAIRDKNGKPIRMLGAHQDISDIKRNEQELFKAKEKAEESEAKYRALFENMNAGFVLFEVVQNEQGMPIDLIILAANEGFEKTTGLNLKAAVGKRLKEVLKGIEKDESEWIATYSKVALAGESIQFEQGSELLGQYYSISAYQAGTKQCAVTFVDITVRKQAENALARKSKLLEESQVLANLGSWEWDIANDTWYFSEQWKNIHGLSDDDVPTSKLFEIAHPEDASNIEKAITDAKEQGKTYDIEHRIIRADNREIRHIKAFGEVEFDQNTGRPARMVGTAQDITERKQAENELKLQNVLLKTQQEVSMDGILIVNEEDKIVSFNQRFADIWEIPYEIMSLQSSEKALRYVLPKLTNPDEFTQRIHDLYENKQEKSCEEVFLTDGKILERYSSPLIGSENEYYGRIWYYRDITERKRAQLLLQEKSEETVAQNEALQKLNAQKDKFFSIIAHDLKSPFNSIMGFSEILIERISKKDYKGIEKYAGIILQSSQKAVDLLMNLMEWAQSQTGRMEFNPKQFDLTESIHAITLMFDDIAGHKGIVIKKELPQKATVFADQAMVNTVLRNLLSNAIKFTKSGGEIIVAATKEKNTLTASVTDNGIGIPNDLIDKLFRIDENYSTRGTANEVGTGLGLILCKELIEKHDEKIWVKSEEGKGSTFYFTLPHNHE